MVKRNQRYFWDVRSDKKRRKYEEWLRAKSNYEFTERAKQYFQELGQHPEYPDWPNITEQENKLIWDYAGQKVFEKGDMMFIRRMRDKIFGHDPLGFIQEM